MPYKQSNFLVIMNYEKKYKDALELARIAAFNGHQSLMEGIFPELAESEDEKIRKELIDIVEKSPITFAFEDKGKVLAWLEKQGEQKSDWSEEDEEHIHSLLDRLEGMCKKGSTFITTRFAVNQDMDWLKSLKQRIGGEQ